MKAFVFASVQYVFVFLSFVERLRLHVSAVGFAEGARCISRGKVKGCRESSVCVIFACQAQT